MIDLLYLTHNRLEFTRASLAALLANTSWEKVRNLWLYDDRSTDGTVQHLRTLDPYEWCSRVSCRIAERPFGGPVGAMLDFIDCSSDSDGSEVFAKIDSDVIVPPGWLDACLTVMDQHPQLDLLGIEPPASRTLAPWATERALAPEFADPRGRSGDIGSAYGYAPCDSIGGIGLMRTRAFRDRAPMRPHGPNGVGGFTDWQLANPDVRKGWIVPPLNLFLLDRLPIEPWASLSREYIAKGWQRAWTNYGPEAAALWSWWAALSPDSARRDRLSPSPAVSA